MALDFNVISEDHVIKGSYDVINDTPHGKSKSSQVWLQKYNSFLFAHNLVVIGNVVVEILWF